MFEGDVPKMQSYRGPVDFALFLGRENCPVFHCRQLKSVFSMDL